MARETAGGYATIVGSRSAFLFGLMTSLGVLAGCSGVSTGTGTGGTSAEGGAPASADDPSQPSEPAPSPGASSSTTPPTASGVTYPSTNLGWKPRLGSARGDTIPNVRLSGFAPNDATPTTIAMADLYDPQGQTHDAIIVAAVSSWDPYSKALVPRALASKARVRVLSVLGEAQSPGKAATMADLATWRGQFPAATHMLDAGFANFGVAFDQQAVPFVMVVIARTMEICTSALGLPTEADLAADVARCIAR